MQSTNKVSEILNSVHQLTPDERDQLAGELLRMLLMDTSAPAGKPSAGCDPDNDRLNELREISFQLRRLNRILGDNPNPYF